MRNAANRMRMTTLLAAAVLVLLGLGAASAQDKPITATDAWVKLPEPGAKSTVACHHQQPRDVRDLSRVGHDATWRGRSIPRCQQGQRGAGGRHRHCVRVRPT